VVFRSSSQGPQRQSLNSFIEDHSAEYAYFAFLQLRLSLDGHTQEAGNLTHVSKAELVDESENEYAFNACLEGVTGTYHLKLSLPEAEASGNSMEEPRGEARLAAKWKVRLCAGEFDKLEAFMEDSPVTTTMRMVRGEWLEGLTARAVDPLENLCTQLDRVSCTVVSSHQPPCILTASE
jgi:hypothetical protein